MNQQRVNRQHS